RKCSILRCNLKVGAGPVHGIRSSLAEHRPSDRNLNPISGTFEYLGDGAAIRNAAGNADDQVRLGSRTANIPVQVIVPRQLVLIVTRSISGGWELVIVVRNKEIETKPKLFQLGRTFDSLASGLRPGQQIGRASCRERV